VKTFLWALVSFLPVFTTSYVLFPKSQDIGKGIYLMLFPPPFLAWLAGIALLIRLIEELRSTTATQRRSGVTLLKLFVVISLFALTLSYLYTSCCGTPSPNQPLTSRPNA